MQFDSFVNSRHKTLLVVSQKNAPAQIWKNLVVTIPLVITLVSI